MLERRLQWSHTWQKFLWDLQAQVSWQGRAEQRAMSVERWIEKGSRFGSINQILASFPDFCQ